MKVVHLFILLVVAIGGMAISRDVSSGDDRLVRLGEMGQLNGSVDACDAATVERRLTELFAAISNGEGDIPERFFAYGKEAPFQWYSFTERHLGIQDHYVTYSRDSLAQKFAGVGDSSVRMVLRSVTVNRFGMGALHFGPVEFDFFDGSNNSEGQRGYSGTGKGAYHCTTESFIVLSLGTRSPKAD